MHIIACVHVTCMVVTVNAICEDLWMEFDPLGNGEMGITLNLPETDLF